MGVRLLLPAVGALMDRMPDPAVVARIGAAAGSVPGVEAIEQLRVRAFGPGCSRKFTSRPTR